mmetsp:Transcript_9563/g.19477  ORF Transcript_9563/g.19477 Transcript_9563/m.19477 type:complete len:491 (-) Transcript_9563:57-1529(-)
MNRPQPHSTKTIICLLIIAVASSFKYPQIFVSSLNNAPYTHAMPHSHSTFLPEPPKEGRKIGTRLEASAVSVPSRGGGAETGATIPNEVFNLVKNIVGAGVLSLPAGVAAFGNAPSALIPATILISVIGVMSGYCFSLIGRVCEMTGATSYRGCWDKTVGTSSSWLPASACTFKTGAANIAYSMILADTFKALAATAGYEISRANTLFGITGAVLLPLCLMKNLASLAPFSLLGIAGMGFTTFAMFVRYIGGSYAVPTGKFVGDLAPSLVPSFGTAGASAALTPPAAILLCMLSTAYLAHYNAPKYFSELRNNTVPRFNKMVSYSFFIAISFFAAVTSIGFLTFGASSNGFILNNYSTKDQLATISRIAVAVSIVFSYPLTFVGIREGIMDLAKVPVDKRTRLSTPLSIVILAAVTGAALTIKDLSFILSFGGATLGNAIVFLFPVIMFNSAVKKFGKKELEKEATASKSIFVAGVLMSVIGAKQALKSL